jgi:hypothetical protein
MQRRRRSVAQLRTNLRPKRWTVRIPRDGENDMNQNQGGGQQNQGGQQGGQQGGAGHPKPGQQQEPGQGGQQGGEQKSGQGGKQNPQR